MSPLPAHQSDRKPRVFPGHILTSSACLPRRIGLRGGTPSPPSACSGISLPCSAAYRQSGECATSIDSRTPHCFSVTTTASPRRGYGRGACGERGGVAKVVNISINVLHAQYTRGKDAAKMVTFAKAISWRPHHHHDSMTSSPRPRRFHHCMSCSSSWHKLSRTC